MHLTRQPRGSCGAQAGISRWWHLLGILLLKGLCIRRGMFLAELRDALNGGVETWRSMQKNGSIAEGYVSG